MISILFFLLCSAWLIKRYYASIYDFFIVHMTKDWYKAVLDDIEPNSKILDIGIGTGTALLQNKKLVIDKKMVVVGVDYDKYYVTSAQENIIKEDMQKSVTVHCQSIYDKELGTTVGNDFDVAYFSGSWSLMPNAVEAVISATRLLKESEVRYIYITQTFKPKSSALMKVLKPCLRYLTTIDFGKVTSTYEMETYLQSIEETKVANTSFKVVRKEIIQEYYSTYLIKIKVEKQ